MLPLSSNVRPYPVNCDAYIKLMKFPQEWIEWGMLPTDLIRQLIKTYEPGMENASEHDRHGVFQWWLNGHPSAEQLVFLARLSWLDPDDVMGASVRDCMRQRQGIPAAVADALASPYYRA